MNHLPLPNWNFPPNAPPRGNFSGFVNTGYGRLPFAPHPYPAYRPPSLHMSVPRHPFYYQPDQEPIQTRQHPSPLPKSEDFSCDVCERSFQSKQILQAHLQSHVKCDSEGCSFTASRKMLKLHFIQNHAKGRMRIKLDTPEEIQKWREQRRKRYPTVANVQKKLAEMQARNESGQVAETQTFRYRGRGQRNDSHRNRQKHSKFEKQGRHSETQINQSTDNMVIQSMTTDENSPIVDPLSMVLDITSNNSDSEERSVDSSVKTSPVASSALMSLCCYGDDSSGDESDEAKEVNNNKQVIKPIQEIQSKQSISQNTENHPPSQRQSRKRKQELQKSGGAQAKKRATLLEKLLAPEIRHETNVILQCIRYVVKNHFFDTK